MYVSSTKEPVDLCIKKSVAQFTISHHNEILVQLSNVTNIKWAESQTWLHTPRHLFFKWWRTDLKHAARNRENAIK